MSLSDWGILVAIASAVASPLAMMGKAIIVRLRHLDGCIDSARQETRQQAERVRAALVAEQDRVRAELLDGQQVTRQQLRDHVEEERPKQARVEDGLAALTHRVGHVERMVAWIAGKMGSPFEDVE